MSLLKNIKKRRLMVINQMLICVLSCMYVLLLEINRHYNMGRGGVDVITYTVRLKGPKHNFRFFFNVLNGLLVHFDD